MISLITCTGFRPEAFALCHKYVCRQTYKGPIQWIVITDDPDKSTLISTLKSVPTNIHPELYNGPDEWKPEFNTQRGNMNEALKHVKGQKVLFIEDDEWYSPRYVDEMFKLLNFVDICGETNALYYHVQIPGWKRMHNYRHVSLCQTGIKSSLLPNIIKAVNSGEMYFDINLWNQAHEQRVSCCLFESMDLCVGMKGLPGRGGLGAGHKNRDYLMDPGLVKLREVIGPDVELYKPFVRKYEKESKSPAIRGNESRQTKLNGQSRNDGRARGEAPK